MQQGLVTCWRRSLGTHLTHVVFPWWWCPCQLKFKFVGKLDHCVDPNLNVLFDLLAKDTCIKEKHSKQFWVWLGKW